MHGMAKLAKVPVIVMTVLTVGSSSVSAKTASDPLSLDGWHHL